MCESRSSTISWPARVCATTEIRFPIVPEGTNRPASLPSRAAAIASRRCTVGSSPHTSSPTSARAMASRISGVGSVSVSERRSTMSCTGLLLALRPQALDGALAPLGEAVVVGELAKQLHRLAVLALGEVDLGQRVERFRDHQCAGVLLEDELQPLSRRAGVALVEVVPGHPHFLLRQPASAHVDLGQGVGGVAAVRVLLDQLLELLHRLGGEPLVLLDGLELVVVAHGEPVLDQVGDLVARIEGEERLELLHRLVELRFPVECLADQEARARRPRRVRMPLGDLAEGLARLRVTAPLQLLLADRVELVGRQDGHRGRAQVCAAAGQSQQRAREEKTSYRSGEHPHEKLAHTYSIITPMLPTMLRLRQTFQRPRVADVPAAVAQALQAGRLPVKRGDTVAVGAGSRGIANIDVVVRATVRYLL